MSLMLGFLSAQLFKTNVQLCPITLNEIDFCLLLRKRKGIRMRKKEGFTDFTKVRQVGAEGLCNCSLQLLSSVAQSHLITF